MKHKAREVEKGKKQKRGKIFLWGFLSLLLLCVLLGFFLKNRYLGRRLVIQKGEKSIYGRLFLPAWGKAPLVILGHGYGGSYSDNLDYGRFFADHGVACYCFDFCGGSRESKSSGRMEDMSLLTEMEDMRDILEALQKEKRVEKSGIFLAGKSLGGAVAALVGAEKETEIAGLILHYPFFVVSEALQERMKQAAGSGEAAGTGEKESSGGEGKESPQVVAEDVFERIATFRGPVILFNGDKDKYVPLENTQKACEAYENAKLVVLKGSGHGFSGKARDTVKEKMVSFVWEVMKERE